MPKHLQRWTRPDSYAGAQWDEYYVLVSQHRDSDALERSNFRVALQRLGGESEQVVVAHAGHWAVGWIDLLLIHESATEALAVADEIARKLDGYPVLSEEDWSDLEWTEATEWWVNMGLRSRVELCQEAGVSVFAARRLEVPDDSNGKVYELLTRN